MTTSTHQSGCVTCWMGQPVLVLPTVERVTGSSSNCSIPEGSPGAGPHAPSTSEEALLRDHMIWVGARLSQATR